MAGKKPRYESNTQLAKSHNQGASVGLTQIAKNKKYGSLGYIVYQKTFRLHLYLAQTEYRKTELHFAGLINKHPAQAGLRLYDYEHTKELVPFVRSGYSLIINSWLAIEALTADARRVFINLKQASGDWEGGDILGRLEEVAKHIGIEPVPQKLRANIAELERIRNQLLHPKGSSFYGHDEAWDGVPLAWLLSERRKLAVRTAEEVVKHFDNSLTSYAQAHSQEVTLNVQRGLEFTDDVKGRYEAE